MRQIAALLHISAHCTLIKDDEIEFEQTFGNLPCLVGCFFLFERVDQIDRGKEAHFSAMMLDGLNSQCVNRR